MKKHVLLLSLLFANLAVADFDQAMQWYEEQSYDQAYAEFTRLAHLGNHRAQYNLAVMYLHGQHVERNLFQAYAWAKMAQELAKPEYQAITKKLLSQFSESEQKQAEQAHHELAEHFGQAAIHAKFAPIVYQTDDANKQTERPFKLKVVKRKPPRYPEDAFYQRVQGWATIGFEVFPDGSVRNTQVIDAYPQEVFEKESLKTVQKFQFEVEFNEGTEPFPIYARQTIEFTLENLADQKKLRQLYDDRLQQLLDYANQGSGQAQYLYAIAASSNLLNRDNKISKAEVNDWLLKAAQNGHHDAQFLLGKNLLSGDGCQVEKQKAVNWIVHAAEQGHARASRKAYELLTQHQHLNNTEKPAEHWLRQAAEGGDADAQIDLAEFLVAQPSPTSDDLQLARNMLDQFEEKRDETVKWYQVSAQVYSAAGEPKKAQKHQKKAHKLAKKLGWDLSL